MRAKKKLREYFGEIEPWKLKRKSKEFLLGRFVSFDPEVMNVVGNVDSQNLKNGDHDKIDK